MQFGISLGICLAVKFVLTAQQLQYSWLGILVWLLGLYVLFALYSSTVHFKYTECGGKITFGNAYAHVFYLMLFASLVAAMLRWGYLRWFDHNYLRAMYDSTGPVIEKLQPMMGQTSYGSIDEFTKEWEQMFTPVRFSIYYIFYDIFVALFLGLLIAPLAVRARNYTPPEEDNDNDEQI